MASPFLFQLAATLLVTLVHRCPAEKTSQPRFFNLDEEVRKYLEMKAREQNVEVAWWDMNAEHDYIKRIGATEIKVTVTVGPVKYGEMKTSAMRPKRVYTHWVHNNQPTEPQKFTLRKTTERKRSATWTVQNGFRFADASKTSKSIEARVGLPFYGVSFGVGGSATSEESSSLCLDGRHGHTRVLSETEKFEVDQVITVPPMKSVKVEWSITDVVKEVPWTAIVEAEGVVFAMFKSSVPLEPDAGFLFPISELSGRSPHLKKGGDHTVQYTAEGVFTVANAEDSRLNVTEFDYDQMYSGKPSGVKTYTVPLNLPQPKYEANTP